MFVKLTQKCFFPYSYLDSFEKFKETLPTYVDSCKNSLTGAIDITLSDYQHALNIYQKFGSRNLGDYHDIYLKTDVLLMADLFANFKNVCLKVYTFDPSHFYSAPNLSWESMLISANVKLGLLQDVDMLLFFERVNRGGINGVGELRHFIAKNPHLNSFDPNEKTTLWAFSDVTSLYASTMQKFMPLGNYKWNSVISLNKILGMPEDSNVGYFVEVHLKNPQHLHDSHKGLPLAPGEIRTSWFSSFATTVELKSNKHQNWRKHSLTKKLCVSLQEPEILRYKWFGCGQIAPSMLIRTEQMVGRPYGKEHCYAQAGCKLF